MRQLKGKVKENAKEKRERKKEFMENKENAFRIGIRIWFQFLDFIFPPLCSSSLHRRGLRADLRDGVHGDQAQARGRVKQRRQQRPKCIYIFYI